MYSEYDRQIDQNLGYFQNTFNLGPNAPGPFANGTVDTAPVPAGVIWKVRRATGTILTNNGGPADDGHFGIYLCPPQTPAYQANNSPTSSIQIIFPIIGNLIRVDDPTNAILSGSSGWVVLATEFTVPPQWFIRFFALLSALQNQPAPAQMNLNIEYAALTACS